MGNCRINHSYKDVSEKLKAQESYLPDRIQSLAGHMKEENMTQQKLNALFHLLKKYDLADSEERIRRDLQFEEILKGQ